VSAALCLLTLLELGTAPLAHAGSNRAAQARTYLSARGSIASLDVLPTQEGVILSFVGNLPLNTDTLPADTQAAREILGALRSALNLGAGDYRAQAPAGTRASDGRRVSFDTYVRGIVVAGGTATVEIENGNAITAITGLFPQLAGTAVIDADISVGDAVIAAAQGIAPDAWHRLIRNADGSPALETALFAVPGRPNPVWYVDAGQRFQARIDAVTGKVISREFGRQETPY
jgi:hypothetical protein